MSQDKSKPIEHRDGKQVDDNIDDLGRPVNAPDPEPDETPPHPGDRDAGSGVGQDPRPRR